MSDLSYLAVGVLALGVCIGMIFPDLDIRAIWYYIKGKFK